MADLDGDGKNELDRRLLLRVSCSTAKGSCCDRVDDNGGRVYAPHVVADLEGDGVPEIVFGSAP